ncbi:MAG: hypothetical protein K8R46_10980 [Pirellulales bacterium]|nr:hypothetical protein [Pirellulales bacterium]
MSKTGWRWRRGLVAVAGASCLFLLCLQPAMFKSLNLCDMHDLLPTLFFYVIFAALVFWLFGRPKNNST